MINISIIMPLYNASRYLGETLVSILKQTYVEFELICVDDASDDNTLNILYSFCKIDKRIKILSNDKRMGAAYSRNRGIKEARGEYIIFLDGDDIFDEEMLELASQEMERTNADIVVYECTVVPSEDIYKKRTVKRTDNFINKYCKHTFSIKEYGPIEMMYWRTSTWSRLYRKSLIDDNCLEFQTLPCANDVYFSLMAMMLTDKIIRLNDSRVMVYARDHFEVTRISYDRDPMCTYLAIDKIGKELSERKLFREYSQHYYFLVFCYMRTALMKTKTTEKAKEFYDFLANEGIDNLISPYEKDCVIENDYIKELLENFKKLSFESNWYSHEDLYKCYLYTNADNILKIVKECKSKGLKIILWGVGVNGKKLLDLFEIKHIRIDGVVDKDVSKQGDKICGYVIKEPQKIWENSNVIYVTSDKIYDDILDDANQKGIEVVNIRNVIGF